MTSKKCGLILAIMACFLIGISSGGFVDEQIAANTPSWFVPYEPFNTSGWSEPGWFGVDYEPFTFGSGWINSDYEPLNTSGWSEPGWFGVDYEPFTPDPSTFNSGWFGYDISDYLYPTAETNTSQLKPEPIIVPESPSISKEELIKSKKFVISTEKQSLISSLSSGGGKSTFF